MIWLLRRFAAFRDLEQRLALASRSLDAVTRQLHEAQAGALRAEQECIHLREQCDKWRDDSRAMQLEAINAVKTLANERWQRQYGTPLYQDVATIPEARVPFSESGAVAPGKTSVRLQQESMHQQFLKEAEAQWEAAQRK